MNSHCKHCISMWVKNIYNVFLTKRRKNLFKLCFYIVNYGCSTCSLQLVYGVKSGGISVLLKLVHLHEYEGGRWTSPLLTHLHFVLSFFVSVVNFLCWQRHWGFIRCVLCHHSLDCFNSAQMHASSVSHCSGLCPCHLPGGRWGLYGSPVPWWREIIRVKMNHYLTSWCKAVGPWGLFRTWLYTHAWLYKAEEQWGWEGAAGGGGKTQPAFSSLILWYFNLVVERHHEQESDGHLFLRNGKFF